MKDLKEKVIQGGFAKLCSQAANFLIRIGSVMVLSRLLTPKDYGLVGMVTVVTGVYSKFLYAGLSSAAVQRASLTDEQHSTLFWINMFLGVLLGLLLIATAPVLVSFYNEPRLFWVTVTMAAGFLFNAAGVQHIAFLQRQMRFVAISKIEIFTQLASLVVGITLAAKGFGYWALVGMSIASPAIFTCCVWFATKWLPKMPRRRIGMRSLLSFGGTVTLTSLVMYLANNLDKLLLGRLWGADALGIYGRGYQLINIPNDTLNGAIGGVAFSALSRIQDDIQRFKNYFLKGYALVISMTLPITFFCALFAEDIILVLLGPKWKSVADVFRLMAPTVMVFGILNPLGWLLQSTARQKRSLKIALVIAPVAITAYCIGLNYGPKGVACAYSAAMLFLLGPLMFWCIHETMITLKDILLAISKPFFSGLLAAAFASITLFFCSKLPNPFLRLFLEGVAMFGTYLLMLLFVFGQKTFYLNIFCGMKNQTSFKEENPASSNISI
jgi:PST family polysaccharide transporter